MGDTTQKAALSLLLGTCQGIWEGSKGGFVCSITSLILMLGSVLCASDVSCFPGMLSEKKKKACV